MQDFHNIRAWVRANALAMAIKRLTDRFPKSEYRTLRGQMVRSAESIADNISEGAGAATNREFARYLDMSIKSCSELEGQLERAHGYGLTGDREAERYLDEVRLIRKMTWGLRRKVLGTPSNERDVERVDEQRKTGTKTQNERDVERVDEQRKTGTKTQNERRRTDARAVPPGAAPSRSTQSAENEKRTHGQREVPP